MTLGFNFKACVALGLIASFQIGKCIIHIKRRLSGNDVDNTPETFEPTTGKSTRTVLVLGWGGAKKAHLRRIIESYTSKGDVVIYYTTPLYQFVREGVEAEELDKVINQVESVINNKQCQSLFIHLHSNNGTFTMGGLLFRNRARISEKGKDADVFKKLKGVIFDCAPSLSYHKTKSHRIPALAYAVGLTPATIPLVMGKPIPFPGTLTVFFPLTIITVTAGILYNRYFNFKRKASVSLDLMKDCVEDDTCNIKVPYKFLYSTQDKVIPEVGVLRYAKKQIALGRIVSLSRFTGDHVDLLRGNGLPYLQDIDDFIQSCSTK